MTSETTQPAKGAREVTFLRGYFPADGGDKIQAGETRALPADEARSVVKAEIAKLKSDLD